MTRMVFVEMATIIAYLAKDWYQTLGVPLLKRKVGAKSGFGDLQVITLLLLIDYLPFSGEWQFLGLVSANSLVFLPGSCTKANCIARPAACTSSSKSCGDTGPRSRVPT